VEQAAIEQERSEGDRLEALHELTSVKDAKQLTQLQPLLQDSNERLRIRTAALLVSAGDTIAFRSVEPDLVKRKNQIDPFAARAIALAIANFLKGHEAIPEVKDLLKNGNRELRAAAALALRNIGSNEGVQALLNALDDPDYNVRFNSTLSLTALTEQYQLGALESDFQKKENQIIQAWKKWGAENGFQVAHLGGI
jgi:HEAT repeat protein